MAKKLNTRAHAANLAYRIIDHGQSLDASLQQCFGDAELSNQDRGFVQELVYGVCRWYGELDAYASTLLRSPIRKKDRVVHFVLLTGLYQLRHLDTAEHAAVGETVAACQQLNKQWAKKLINGCLRTFLRQTPDLEQAPEQLAHPQWIRQAIQQAWPEHADKIITANNQRPPMCLRVNRMHHSRDDYLAQLIKSELDALPDPHAPDGIIMQQAVAVSALPGFFDGAVSVQDTAAQLAADILVTTPGLSVLDACAAPGGKAAHLLERTNNDLQLDALDISERRCEQLHETLTRLQLGANIMTVDARQTDQWDAPPSGYDRILIDAPCSGLGVIRRHPDIRHHRRPSDIAQLNQIQQQLLTQLWSTLKPGGQMLYMTCSVLPEENEQQIVRFLKHTPDAQLQPVKHPNALSLANGVQTLPGVHEMDGFYYCLLSKPA